MKKNKIATYFLLVVVLLFYGCTVFKKATRGALPIIKERPLTYDVVVFEDLELIDLDNDGEEDIIAIYSSFLNSKGVKVIKVKNNRAETIFRRLYTPDTKVSIREDIPEIVIRRSFHIVWWGIKDIYSWNGETFIFKE